MPDALAALRPWDAPELTSLGRLPMRSPLVAFPDARSARSTDRDRSPWFLRLDGRWRFTRCPSPEDAPAGWERPRFDDAGWREVDVPGCWTMQGDDRPIYTNVQMPFDATPPHPPRDNPTGLYRTTFDLPARWERRRVVLSVGSAESVLLVHVNGSPVGISKDSRLAAEFDITAFLHPGHNVLACMVVRWSDASYLEDQDHWWHAGIEREVFLRATDRAWIEDVRATAGLADDLATGTLEVRVEAGFADEPRPGWTVAAVVESLDGEAVAAFDAEVPTRRRIGFTGHVVRFRGTVDDVRPWSHEDPALYRLVVTLADPAGRVREVTTCRLGFRRVEVRERELLINGAPVLIRGVNRHDFHPVTGRVVTVEEMRADLVVLKRFGFNAVRTSHYPNDPRFLDLCDELGFYVVDEADIETHAHMFTLCHDPRYLAAWLDRGTRMVRRDKNHPSVVLWSLGNESGHGGHHDALAAWIRRYDPSRPLHYEGAIMLDWAGGRALTDVVCPMYPAVDALVAWARDAGGRGEDRPLIMCEYSHAMGNSNGSLSDYWDAIESTPGLQGGFIWELWDHGLRQVLPDGTVRWAYGGDFGDAPNDGTFCIDGVLWPDRTPKPALEEHKALAAPVGVRDRDASRRGRIEVVNRQWWRDLGWLRATWEVSIDGDAVQQGDLTLPDIAPRSSAVIEVPVDRAALGRSPGERWLTVRFATAEATPWAPAGFEVATAQLPLAGATDRRTASSGPKARAGRGADGPVGTVGLDGDGTIARVTDAGGRDLLTSPPVLSLWRAPIENDRVHAGRPEAETTAARWRAWGVDRLTLATATARRSAGGAVTRTETWTTAGGDEVVRRQRVTPAAWGAAVEEEVRIPRRLDDLARVGIVFTIAGGLEQVEWFGLGPHETYPDRARSGLVGRWRSTVAGQYVPYIRPEEHGGHEQTRWLGVHDGASSGVVVALPEPLHTSVSHFTAADLDAATHDVELHPRAESEVHVDAAHRGLGTASCGPDTLPRYLVRAGIHRWRWAIAAFDPSNDDLAALARAMRAEHAPEGR
ncbi:MAG TPA: glycoside hydrolase family 2 TIM barrel-domain containing protein [Acidimicrobiales bacterium]|nr:glycoside hydrolase family 2 TIM barrel-domain containing protein [Acidimicrobiales bacterium]